MRKRLSAHSMCSWSICVSSMLTLFTKYLLSFFSYGIVFFFDGSSSHFQFDRYSLCVWKICCCCCFFSCSTYFSVVLLHLFFVCPVVVIVMRRLLFASATSIATKHFVSLNVRSLAVNEIGFKVDNNKIFVYLTCRAYILIYWLNII